MGVLASRKRGVGNMLSCMVCMLLLFIVIYLGMDIYGRMNLAIKKSRIERTYLLYMETYGYLAPDKRALLTEQLADIGVENISYTGTTLTPAGYGQEVILSVTGTIRTNAVTGIAQGLSFIREGSSDFKIYQKSTAKNRDY